LKYDYHILVILKKILNRELTPNTFVVVKGYDNIFMIIFEKMESEQFRIPTMQIQLQHVGSITKKKKGGSEKKLNIDRYNHFILNFFGCMYIWYTMR
jgi:hypothetical protein